MSHAVQWLLGASPSVLRKRAALNARIRDFFAQRTVLEVETPVLGNYTATDAFTASISYASNIGTGYLQTSPESYLKQYIAHYPDTDVFNLSKVFRDDISAQYHQPEFTMLEWYRHLFDWKKLSNEVIELIRTLHETCAQEGPKKIIKVQKLSYQECFQRFVGECIFDETVNWYKTYCQSKFALPKVIGVAKSDSKLWKQLLWNHLIEPHFCNTDRHEHQDLITVVYDFPAELAIMAKIGPADGKKHISGQSGEVAKRFEIYYNGIELANGWEESNCVKSIAKQMQMDIDERKARNLSYPPIDQPLLDAIDKIKTVSGVALGIDRLYAQIQNFSTIHQTLAFYAKPI